MNKNILLIILFIFFSCGKLEPKLDNVFDPDNPNYDSPIVQIDSGPLDGSTIYNNSVEITWSGNELVTDYRYDFYRGNNPPNNHNWSTGWNKQTSETFNMLDEAKFYIYFQSRYENGDTSSIETVSFTIDAVVGPAVLIYPMEQIKPIDEIATINILAEEVTDLSAAEFSIVYDSNSLDVISIDQGDIFEGIGNVLFLSETQQSTPDTVKITTAVWGDSKPAFTGTGVIAKIQFKILVNGIHSVNIDSDAVLRDCDNNEMSVSEVRGGKIYAQ